METVGVDSDKSWFISDSVSGMGAGVLRIWLMIQSQPFWGFSFPEKLILHPPRLSSQIPAVPGLM